LHSRSNAPAIRPAAELSPVSTSLLGHLLLTGLVAAALLRPAAKETQVEIAVIEAPQVSASAQLKPIAPAAPRAPQPERRAVYGVSKRSLTTPDGESVKLGNTLAKEADDRKLRPEDAESLPIPADEFMVTSMPELDSEIRIPYPPEAREKRIQGAVVMDLLIDAEGRIREARLIQGPGAGLNEAALSAVRSFKFKPARIQAQSVAVRIRYAYRFVLEK